MKLRFETNTHLLRLDVDTNPAHGLFWGLSHTFGWIARVWPFLVEWTEEEAIDPSDPVDYNRWVIDNQSPDYWG